MESKDKILKEDVIELPDESPFGVGDSHDDQDDPDALADTAQLNGKIKLEREKSSEYS